MDPPGAVAADADDANEEEEEPNINHHGGAQAVDNLLLQQQQQAIDNMRITDEERQWARDLRQAVDESDELEALSDMDYAQYAICTRGNIREALFRIEGMQAFRKEYKIDNTPQQGADHLARAMSIVPGFVLHLDNCPDNNEAILVWDASMFLPDKVLAICPERGPHYNWRTYVVAAYYMNYASQPSLASIRDGLTLLMDCGKVGWENTSMDFEKRMHDELRAFYPLRWKRILAYNTGVISNLGWGLFKQFMNPQMRDSLKLGCQVMGTEAGTRLCDLFLQPSMEEAKANIMRRCRVLLMIRNEYEKNFRL